MNGKPGAARALIQEIYLQDLTLAIYGIYADRLGDETGRTLLEQYLRGERFRAAQIENYLARHRLEAAPAVRSFFRGIGGLYGHVTSWLGTRMMLRIVLSASRRASRRACGALDASADLPDLVFLATLRARSEGDLLDGLRQHLINTGRPPRIEK